MKRTLLAIFCGAGLAVSAFAQSSDYYLSDGSSLTISVLNERTIARQWQARSDSMPIAVSGTIRTYCEYSSNFGSEYALDGTWTGVDYPHRGEPNGGQNVDGATDGEERNWLAGFNDGAIWEFNSAWESPIRLFEAPSPTGVTYDATSGNLWVVQFSTGTIVQYTLSGQQVSSFAYSSPSNWLGALAWEPATDTLWAEEFSTGTVYQFDKEDGTVLQEFVVPGLAGYVWGGEFAMTPTSCDPCDANCDGVIDAFDIEPFIDVLLGGAGCSACAGDTNGDGTIDAFDIEPFINCLVGP